MRYLPHTQDQIKKMLSAMGVDSIDDLFQDIPEAYRLNRPLNLPEGLDEHSLMRHLDTLANKNTSARMLSFLGAGAYDHHVPPVVDQLLLRSEFYTAYTPYQAEVAQGTLQAIYEFQTLVCQLFELDVANASLYDGASAAAEAVLMARRITKKKKVVLSEGLHPETIEVVKTYLAGLDDGSPEMVLAPVNDQGITCAQTLSDLIDDQTAAVVIGYPNFFGCVEPLAEVRELARENQALLVTATQEPYALSLLKPPGAYGVDIAVGEGQSMAVPPQYGGPGVGIFACKQQYLRQVPGRLVGQTVDQAGKRGFVLTLSTREQHIRRERATSNICTNHGLIALAFTIRTALLGQKGFQDVGKACFHNAQYLKEAIGKLDGWSLRYSTPSFNEFVVEVDPSKGTAQQCIEYLDEHSEIQAGVALSRFFEKRPQELLVAVTEKHTREDLDLLVDALRSMPKA